jgi:YVTN family beta-propeller protein
MNLGRSIIHRLGGFVLTLLILLPATAHGGGTLIVLNKAEATASLLDLESGEERARLDTGDGPHEVAVSPNGNVAVVANYGGRGAPGSTLTVIDLTKAAVRHTIDLKQYHRPHGIVYFAGGKRVTVTAEEEGMLLIVDVEKGVVEKAIKTTAFISHMVAITPDASRAFVANIGSGSISVIDLEKGELIQQLPTGGGAEGIDVSPDGKVVWVSNRGADTVSVVDTESLEIKATLECASFPIRVKFTPDGKHVLVSNARSGDVAIFNADSHEEVKRISMKARPVDETDQRLFGDDFGDSPVPVGILVEPSGKRAYVANTNADVITVLDLESLEIAGRLVAGKEPDGLGFTSLTIPAGD